MAEAYDTINGEDILSNSLRAIKQTIPQMVEKSKAHTKMLDKTAPTYAQEVAFDMGYQKALSDLSMAIKSIGC